MENTQSAKKTFILRDRDKSLTKNWYIEYKEGGKRIKKYGDINHGKTVKERTDRARKFMRELKKQFSQVPQSIDDKEKIYEALENERPFLRKKSYVHAHCISFVWKCNEQSNNTVSSKVYLSLKFLTHIF